MASERWREHRYKVRAPKSPEKHWRLQYKRKNKTGDYGKYEKDWPLRKGVPPWIFKWLLKRVQDLLKGLHRNEKTYHKEFPKIVQALIANGNAQGFKAKATDPEKYYSDVVWYCHGVPLAAILIADLSEEKQLWGKAPDVANQLRANRKNPEGHRLRMMEKKHKAPIRLVWAVSLNGKWFRLGIGRMRKRD
jgi:hypothetical protein